MTYFFYSMDTHNYHVKIDEQKSFKMEGLPSEFVRLSGDFSSRSLESMIVTIPGGQKHGHKYNQPNNSSCILKLKLVYTKIKRSIYENIISRAFFIVNLYLSKYLFFYLYLNVPNFFITSSISSSLRIFGVPRVFVR